MRSSIWTAASVGLLLAPASASPLLSEREKVALHLLERAFPANAPHGYTPQIGSCPQTAPTIRSAANLSPNETSWLEVRRNATVEPMRDLLSRLNITGLDTNAYIKQYQNNASALPNIGIAVSGGGYRAMLVGAGMIEAFDSRTPNSTSAGQLGGLLQASTYLSGLSGGSWLVSTLYANNYTSVNQIITQGSGNLWKLDNTIFEGPDSKGIQLLNSVGYYKSILDAVQGKEDAGFNTSITDYWGRALSYQLVNAADGGPAYTFSSIAQQDWFTQGQAPLPLIVAGNRAPGEVLVSTNSTVFTINPWELGSDDSALYAFAPLQYVGTNFTAGSPRSTDSCVTGYDNVGFVFGTSSSLFNAILTTVNGTNTTGLLSTALQNAIEGILGAIGQDNNDIADWVNPFFGYENSTNINSGVETLTLVDGGEDGQNVPYHPLIQPNRNVDVIFSVDSSADTNATFPTSDSGAGWPDGISIITTYERSLAKISNGTGFPEVPSLNTFMNLGLNAKPTFFGCKNNASAPYPLVVYLPNAPYVFNSNTSTFQMEYNDTTRDAIIANAYEMATQGNSTLDKNWNTCVGCAILSRSLDRTGTKVPDVCTQCFNRYCWNGTVDDRTPGKYDPKLAIPGGEIKVTKSGAMVRFQASMGLVGLVSFLVAGSLML